MDCAGLTLIVGTSLASSGHLMYSTIDAASKGGYGQAAVTGILSIFCASWGGYYTGRYQASFLAFKIKTKNLNL